MVGREAKTKDEKLATKRIAGAGSTMGTRIKGRGAAAEAEKGTGIARKKEEGTKTETMITIEVVIMGGTVSATENGSNYQKNDASCPCLRVQISCWGCCYRQSVWICSIFMPLLAFQVCNESVEEL